MASRSTKPLATQAHSADTLLVTVSRLIEGQDSSASVRRVARNAVVRSLAEIVGKFATFAMFVLIARKLGPTGFGDITFAIALTGNLLIISGVGMDIVVSREAIRNPSLLGTLMATSLVIKLATSVPALLITALSCCHDDQHSTNIDAGDDPASNR